MADRLDHDLADRPTEVLAELLHHRATQNAIVRSYGIMPSSRPEDDDLDRAAAARLRQLTERLDDSWYTDIAERLDAVAVECDELRRQHDNPRSAIGVPDELRGHELDMSDGTVNTPEVTHEIVRDILLRIAAAVEHTQDGQA